MHRCRLSEQPGRLHLIGSRDGPAGPENTNLVFLPLLVLCRTPFRSDRTVVAE